MPHSDEAVKIQASYPEQSSARLANTRYAATLLAAAGLLVTPLTHAAFFTPGQLDVTPSGAASYTVPIAVPPGTAGMVPSLALAYNSQGGNGLLGVGWSLSGLSAVTRCPKTIIQDGAKGGINYDASDKYCLDGQRLISISGTYGANGTEYRTEREGFSKIVSYGSNGYGPTWFKVWTKSGQIMEFGNTADSAIEAQGKTAIRIWAANKIADTKGNYLTVTYTEDNPNGQYYPNRIDYTGNTNANPALAPYNSVRFVYATRPDITPLYDGGALIKTTTRLTNVQTYAKINGVDTLVKDYRLAYATSAATQRSRLVTLTECSGAVSPICVGATGLLWQAGATTPLEQSASFNLSGLSLQLSNRTLGMLLGDFNGDGKTDILRWGDTASNNALYVSNGDGSFTSSGSFNLNTASLQLSNGTIGSLLGDFNGDGKTDILRWGDTASNNALYVSNGDGSFTSSGSFNLNATSLQLSNRTLGISLGDFNGDGRTDILRWGDSASNNALYISNGDGSFTSSGSFNLNATSLQLSNGTMGSLLGDFNGDGKTDILRWGDSASNNALYISNGDGSFTSSGSFNLNATSLQLSNKTLGMLLGDFNGDGKTDILRWGNAVSNNALYFSNGNGGFTQSSNFYVYNMMLGYSTGVYGSLLGDFNGDGKTDILRWGDTYSSNSLLLSNGDGSFTRPGGFNLNTTNLQHSNGTIGSLLGDFNGNGKTDILRWEDAYSSNAVFMNTTQIPDLLVTITNGIGATTSISYKPLTDVAIYTKEAAGIYPVVDIQVPIYVVSSVSSSNGIGGNYVSNYTYAGAKIHQAGGGFLGYHTTASSDAQTGIKSTATFRQDYPYHGLQLSAEKRTSGGILLNQVDNTWSFAANPAWGAQYHVPQLIQSVERSYELTGALISTVTTAKSFDAYGNPTSIIVSTPDGYSKTTSSTYINDTVNWLLGRLTNAVVISSMP